MAKFVISGRADCPHFARAELLGDRLMRNLPDFRIHKIKKHPDDWEDWQKAECKKRGWKFGKSPMIWRELIDRGGKGALIGDANDFQEYCYHYYGAETDMDDNKALHIARENFETQLITMFEEKENQARHQPIEIAIYPAHHPSVYYLLLNLVNGYCFGLKKEISIRLITDQENYQFVLGTQLEIIDCASPCLYHIEIAENVRRGFENAQIILLFDDPQQQQQQQQQKQKQQRAGRTDTREQLLHRNYDYYQYLANIFDDTIHKDTRVFLVDGEFLNFNLCTLAENCRVIPKQQFIAISTVIENRAKSLVAQKLGISGAFLSDVVIWGNLGQTVYCDLFNSKVRQYPGSQWLEADFYQDCLPLIADEKWLQNEFQKELMQRGGKVTQRRLNQLPPAMSTGAAVSRFLHLFFCGTDDNETVSIGVYNDSNYFGIPNGLVVSLPCLIHPRGYYKIREDIQLDDRVQEKLKSIANELILEKAVIDPSIQPLEQPMSDSDHASSAGDAVSSSAEGSTENSTLDESSSQSPQSKDPAFEPPQRALEVIREEEESGMEESSIAEEGDQVE